MNQSELIQIAKARSIAAMTASFHIDPALVCAVCEQESDWIPWAIRYEPAFYVKYIIPSGLGDTTEARARSFSWGLMQIMGETAREEGYAGHMAGLCDPQQGLDSGIEHLRRMLARSAGNEPIALELYNGGGNPTYAAEVMARMGNYK